MGWETGLLVDGSPGDKPYCCESAAFLSESIIREIITGRNLEPSASHLGGLARHRGWDLHYVTTGRGGERG